MMRHILKKTVDQANLTEEALEKLQGFDPIKIPKDQIPKIEYSQVKGKHAFLFMDDGTLLRSFFYENNKTVCSIPIANPVLIYFHTSQSNCKTLSKLELNCWNCLMITKL